MATEDQKLARAENWALYQLRGMLANTHWLRMIRVDSTFLENAIRTEIRIVQNRQKLRKTARKQKEKK